MKSILKMKHWQVFLLMMLFMVIPTDSFIGILISLLSVVFFIAWIYSIGTYAYRRLPEVHGISKKYFDVSCFWVLAYLFSILIAFDGGYTINNDNFHDFGPVVYPLLIGHLYLMWSMFYILYFAAKMLKSDVEKKVVGFNQALLYFFGFWFFPIGIWYLQPKAQRLVD